VNTWSRPKKRHHLRTGSRCGIKGKGRGVTLGERINLDERAKKDAEGSLLRGVRGRGKMMARGKGKSGGKVRLKKAIEEEEKSGRCKTRPSLAEKGGSREGDQDLKRKV